MNELKQQDKARESMPTRPQTVKLKLLDKKSHVKTDIVSFRFGRRSEDNNQNQADHDYYYLNYKAGQYAVVDLGTKEDPEGPIRSFTLASSPTEDSILISTRIRDTPFKKKLASLDVGTYVNMTAPLGKFVLHEDYSKPAVFLSGGIGVTPFRSMIKYATAKQLPVKIILFDANRNQDNILYKNEFEECASLNRNLEIVYTLGTPDNGWKGERGHINQTMATKYLSTNELNNSVFYICGPPRNAKRHERIATG
jgi:glycine betaine catabolism B